MQWTNPIPGDRGRLFQLVGVILMTVGFAMMIAGANPWLITVLFIGGILLFGYYAAREARLTNASKS